MSDKSRDDTELQKIAKTLIDYDFVAIVELRDEVVLKRVQKILAQAGRNYAYQISPAIGRGVKERIAFLYDVSFVEVVTQGQLYPDGADNSDDFIRDPYWATFRAGTFDFSIIAVHILWGTRVTDRRKEIVELADVYKYVQDANGAENDVLLVGDFNRDPSDAKAFGELMTFPSMTPLFQLPQKSHIKDSSLYDNIFFQKQYLTEYLAKAGIDKFDETDFKNDDKAANDAVSDHRPVWAVFRTDGVDDDGASDTAQIVWLFDYRVGDRDAYLESVKATADALQTPKEVKRIATYENRQGTVPHRLVTFEFDSFADMMRYLSRPEIGEQFRTLASRAKQARMHMFLQRFDMAKDKGGTVKIVGVYFVDYPLGQKELYLQWAQQIVPKLMAPATVEADHGL